MLDLADIEMTVQALELSVNGTPESGDIDVGGLPGVAALGVTSLAVVPLYLLGPHRAGGGDKQYAKERGKKRLPMHFSLDSDGSGSVERLESAHSQGGFRESPATDIVPWGYGIIRRFRMLNKVNSSMFLAKIASRARLRLRERIGQNFGTSPRAGS
jgi:hypothetical protein